MRALSWENLGTLNTRAMCDFLFRMAMFQCYCYVRLRVVNFQSFSHVQPSSTIRQIHPVEDRQWESHWHSQCELAAPWPPRATQSWRDVAAKRLVGEEGHNRMSAAYCEAVNQEAMTRNMYRICVLVSGQIGSVLLRLNQGVLTISLWYTMIMTGRVACKSQGQTRRSWS